MDHLMYQLVGAPSAGADERIIRAPSNELLTVAEFCDRTDLIKRLNIIKPQPETDALIAHGIKNFVEEMATASMRNLGPVRLEIELVPGATSADLKIVQLPGSVLQLDAGPAITDLERLLQNAEGRVPPMLLTFTAEGAARGGSHHFKLETRSPHQKAGTPNINTTEFVLQERSAPSSTEGVK